MNFKSGLNSRYQSCLRRCIKLTCGSRDGEYAAIYRTYPEPSVQVWAECLDEVQPSSPAIVYAFHAMGRYEVRLHASGIETVSLRRTKNDAVRTQNMGVPPELIMVAAMEARATLRSNASFRGWITNLVGNVASVFSAASKNS